jgi:hypothetical protein
MGSFRIQNTMDLPQLRQRVYVAGALRSDVYALQVSSSHGTEGSVASVSIPEVDWDAPRNPLRGRSLRIDVAYEGDEFQTVFAGHLDSIQGQARQGEVTVTALSRMGLSDRVYVGSPLRGYVANYPQVAWDGSALRPTGWDVAGVLRDIFGSSQPTWRGGGGNLESSWRAVLRLGPLDALQSLYAQVPLGDLVFQQETLRDVIDRLLAMVGTVSFRERFDGGITYLDFFELADPSAPVLDVVVARRGTSAKGSNVLDVGHEDSSTDVRTRIIALGDKRRLTISISTAHATAPLQKGWNVEDEAFVLADPERAKGRKGEAPDEDLQRVFRRFLLPPALRGIEIDDALALDTADGTAIPIQVWKLPRVLSYNEGTGAWTSTLGTVPVILEGTQLNLASGEFTLREPAINLVSSSVVGTVPVDVYEPALIGITFSVAGPRLLHDTGVKQGSFDFDGIEQAGLAEVISNDSFGFKQISNEGFPFAGETFDATWIFTGDEWLFVDGAQVLQDDLAVLRRFANGALREKSSPRHVYSVTTPYWTPAYKLGDRIRLVGEDGASQEPHQVLSMEYSLGSDHYTSFSTDNQVPLISNEVLGGA